MIKKRILFIYNVMIVVFTIILGRVGYVQIINGEAYIERAYDLWTRNIPVSATRGNIYDRNGKLIVGSTLAPTVSIIPSQIVDKEAVIEKLSDILNIDRSDIAYHFDKNVSIEILKPEARNISIDVAKEIISANIPGVYVSSDTVRYYPYGNLLSHVIGIVGIDNQGVTGIEYMYDSYLTGKSGSQNIYTDAHGNIIEGLTGDYTSSSNGLDIYLTIDVEIQLALERALDNAEKQYAADELMGLVMDPSTSEVLAMASRPNFELNNYQQYSEEVYNRNLPIWCSFEPGSTFKIVTFSSGIEEGVFSLDEHFYDPGYSIVDGVRIRDWKAGGHGDETFLQVIQNSCNPGFVEIGRRLGKEKLFEYIRNYGFGKKTGIDLVGEATGILFNEEKIGNVELATSSFGQGNSVTPIQLLNAANASINGGILNTPYILKGIGIHGTNSLVFQNDTKYVRRVISEKTSMIMRDALERVVALGTARGAYIEGYRVGGKTGTAQIAEGGSYVDNKYILSFMGIAPMNDPKVSCYIAINNAKGTIQYGGIVVSPIVKEVLFESLTLLGVEKQDDEIERDARWYVDKFFYTVENYIGKKVKTINYHPNYGFEIIGDGDLIIAQVPEAGEKIVQDGKIILYTN